VNKFHIFDVNKMIIVFDKIELQEIYEQGYSENRKFWFQPEVIKQYIKIINILLAIEKIEELYQIKSLHFKKLLGSKFALQSIRINNKYRLECIISYDIYVLVGKILSISNHYKS
jgi:proteic killer suppression protein